MHEVYKPARRRRFETARLSMRENAYGTIIRCAYRYQHSINVASTGGLRAIHVLSGSQLGEGQWPSTFGAEDAPGIWPQYRKRKIYQGQRMAYSSGNPWGENDVIDIEQRHKIVEEARGLALAKVLHAQGSYFKMCEYREARKGEEKACAREINETHQRNDHIINQRQAKFTLERYHSKVMVNLKIRREIFV